MLWIGWLPKIPNTKPNAGERKIESKMRAFHKKESKRDDEMGIE